MSTFRVSFEVLSDVIREWVPESFRTTDDAVEFHRQALEQRAAKKWTVRNVRIERIPSCDGDCFAEKDDGINHWNLVI